MSIDWQTRIRTDTADAMKKNTSSCSDTALCLIAATTTWEWKKKIHSWWWPCTRDRDKMWNEWVSSVISFLSQTKLISQTNWLRLCLWRADHRSFPFRLVSTCVNPICCFALHFYFVSLFDIFVGRLSHFVSFAFVFAVDFPFFAHFFCAKTVTVIVVACVVMICDCGNATGKFASPVNANVENDIHISIETDQFDGDIILFVRHSNAAQSEQMLSLAFIRVNQDWNNLISHPNDGLYDIGSLTIDDKFNRLTWRAAKRLHPMGNSNDKLMRLKSMWCDRINCNCFFSTLYLPSTVPSSIIRCYSQCKTFLG